MARNSLNSTPTSVDCVLYWSVYDWFDTRMVNYTINSVTDLASWTDTSIAAQTSYLQPNDIVLTPPNCWSDAGEPNLDTSQCVKTIIAFSQTGPQNFFKSPIGFTSTASRDSSTGRWDVSSEFIQVLFTTAVYSDAIVGAYTNITHNIALGMTNNIRQQLKDAESSGEAQGITYLWTATFHIRWVYMVVPALLVILSAVFLIITIVKSVGHEKWKSSSLPLLFHRLRVTPSSLPKYLMDMEDVASSTVVHLEKDGRYYSFCVTSNLIIARLQ
jgi:hypothetical protein